jgi:hypothetical protein
MAAYLNLSHIPGGQVIEATARLDEDIPRCMDRDRHDRLRKSVEGPNDVELAKLRA